MSFAGPGKRDAELELDITGVNWFSTYKVHTRRVEKFSVGRCFLAGDSAHIHTPAGAQGMNTGIQDGYNLAWKMAAVLRGRASEKILESYNEERLENAKNLLRTTDRLFQFGASSDTFISYFRTHVFPYIAGFALSLDAVKKFVFPRVSQIGSNYRSSSLSVNDGDLAVRAQWDDYMAAYEDAISATSTDYAPWHVVPANNKLARNLMVSAVLIETLESLDMRYPAPPADLAGVVIE